MTTSLVFSKVGFRVPFFHLQDLFGFLRCGKLNAHFGYLGISRFDMGIDKLVWNELIFALNRFKNMDLTFI